MAAILESERRSAKTAVFTALVYCVLSLGAATMVYPFAVMVSSSLASQYDYRRHAPLLAAFYDRSDRFMRSIASVFRTFPREAYPDAPASWTSWPEVAKDREGVRRFAERELSALDAPGAAEAARRRARAFLERLAAADPDDLSCNHDPRDAPRFAKEEYGTIEALNAAWSIPHKSFFDISFTAESRLPKGREGMDPEKFRLWNKFKKSYVEKAIASGDFVSRTMPRDLAANAEDVRAALAIQFRDRGWRDFLCGAAANYRLVGEYLTVRGRALFNTVVLVLLSVAASLTVNPLAAYALSRFALRSTEKILLFLLATMAFPAAVTAIPGFLLLRDLGMLNTFAALVLPGVASGMSIFILKGFFDALPRELYEAAAIDGAGEWTVFLRITLPMTAPILAVNALNSFIHAYASWEWAFLVCNRESHWTLAVWMYQMAADTFAGQPWCVMAGFVLVSVPTAAVFLLCQKVIMRGIVLPSMK